MEACLVLPDGTSAMSDNTSREEANCSEDNEEDKAVNSNDKHKEREDEKGYEDHEAKPKKELSSANPDGQGKEDNKEDDNETVHSNDKADEKDAHEVDEKKLKNALLILKEEPQPKRKQGSPKMETPISSRTRKRKSVPNATPSANALKRRKTKKV
jgi:hypothetical protein